MTVKQARDAARKWMVEEATRIPEFRGAYTAGSSNWLSDDLELPRTSDLDIIVLSDQKHAGRRSKFIYDGVLLEVSFLRKDQFQSPSQVLRNYHLASSFRTTKLMLDPLGDLTSLLAAVSRDYAKRHWIHERCVNAQDKVLEHLRSIDDKPALHDGVMACLFAAGITTHILLVAGLRNPTVRARYSAVREMLAEYGYVEFHETLLELLGSARISRATATRHLATLTEIFDAARRMIKTSFPFASDISDIARPITIDGTVEMIGRGYHREAMFWLGVTHSRCRTVLSQDAPEQLTNTFTDSYKELISDLGVPTSADIRRRCSDIERILPQVWKMAEVIMAANRDIEDD